MKQRFARILTAREKSLLPRPVESIVKTVGALSARWLEKNDAYRRRAVSALGRGAGYTPSMAHAALDALFGSLTAPSLRRLLKSELKDAGILDRFRYLAPGLRCRARGPSFITHVLPANVPNPSVISVVMGLLVKSAGIAKISKDDAGVLSIYRESLAAADKHLAETFQIVKEYSDLKAALRVCGLFVAYGDDKTLEAVRRLTPPAVPFIGYGHRVSVSFFLSDSLTPAHRSEERRVGEEGRSRW